MPSRAEAFLVDNSVFSRRRKRVVADRLAPLIERGLAYTCAPAELEAGIGCTGGDYDRVMELRRKSLIPVHMPDDVWERAVQLQRELAASSLNQGPSVVDLAIALCAEHHGLTVLHYDRDFDTIASVLDVRTEWVAPSGAADGPDDL